MKLKTLHDETKASIAIRALGEWLRERGWVVKFRDIMMPGDRYYISISDTAKTSRLKLHPVMIEYNSDSVSYAVWAPQGRSSQHVPAADPKSFEKIEEMIREA